MPKLTFTDHIYFDMTKTDPARCPSCRRDTGLTFEFITTSDPFVRGLCPCGHTWPEYRVDAPWLEEVLHRNVRSS